jgi:hypothetical protein
LPIERRTMTSCTLTERAFLSLQQRSASINEPWPRRLASRMASLIFQYGEGTSVKSIVMQLCNNTLHDIVHMLLIWSVLFHRKEVLRGYVATTIWRGYCAVMYLPVRASTHR